MPVVLLHEMDLCSTSPQPNLNTSAFFFFPLPPDASKIWGSSGTASFDSSTLLPAPLAAPLPHAPLATLRGGKLPGSCTGRELPRDGPHTPTDLLGGVDDSAGPVACALMS